MNDDMVAVTEEVDVAETRVWDPVKLGRIIGGAMVRAGLETYADVVVEMHRRTGVTCHVNTLSDIKTGKRLPNLELITALMITLNIKHSEVSEAVTEELRGKYIALFRS